MQKEFQTYDVLGIPISVTTLDTARDALVRWSRDDQGRCVGVREVASIMALRETDELLEVSRPKPP